MAKYSTPLPFLDSLETLEDWPLSSDCICDEFNHDLEIVQNFLYEYRGSKATFETYRRELERVLQWSWRIENTSILKLKRTDIELYIEFCQKPPVSWIGIKQEQRTRRSKGKAVINPKWRPFLVRVSKAEKKVGIEPDKKNYQLSQAALSDIFKVLNSFYQFCLVEEKILRNPVALMRQKGKFIRKQQTKAVVRRLTQEQWQTCLATAKKMAAVNPEQHERTLFILSCLYYLYLRVSELTATDQWQPMMKHFYQDSQKRWWFKTVGKGNKERDIAVSDEMLSALKQYRKQRELSPELPTSTDSSPLLHNMRGNENIASRSVVQKSIQACFDRTIEVLKANNKSDEAESLAHASAHWLRHTGISDDINLRKRNIAHVRDDAGHASILTTDRYNDIEVAERHASARHKVFNKKTSEKKAN